MAHTRQDVIHSVHEALTLPDQLRDHATCVQRRQLLSAFVLCTPTARSPGTTDRTRSTRNSAEFRTMTLYLILRGFTIYSLQLLVALALSLGLYHYRTPIT